MDRVAEIKRLYLTATRATIARHVEQAIDLLKAMESDDERERAAVFMDGLAQMRSEWEGAGSSAATRGTRPPAGRSARRRE